MNRILGLIAVSVFLFSCQKEINFSNSGASGGNASLLVRADYKSTTDSSQNNYQINYIYDANKRLIRQITTGTLGGQDNSSDIILVRNSSGIITQAILKSPALSTFGLDSIVTTVYYDNNAKRYRASAEALNLYGLAVVDSTVYNYSGNSVIGTNEYQTFNGLTYIAYKTDNTYAGPNLTMVKSYALDSSGVLSLVSTYKFTYDNKTNPLILPSGEAFILGNYFLVSTNNPLSFQILDETGAITSSENYTYIYNSNNLPQSAKVLDGSGAIFTETFYYQ